MLTEKEMKRIGKNKCIDLFGRQFVTKYKNTACDCWGYEDGMFSYWIGLTDEPEPDVIHLCDGESPYKYYIDMLIDRNTGDIIITDYRTP